MTEVLLKEGEFIIRFSNKDLTKVVLQEEPPLIEIVNPHKDGEIDLTAHYLIKLILSKLALPLQKNAHEITITSQQPFDPEDKITINIEKA